MPLARQKALPLTYKGVKLDCGYRIDIIADNKVVVEIKCVGKILPVHVAQLLTYLKLADIKVGLIINFHSARIKDAIKKLFL
jgi:GxxExxY protein